MTAVLEAPARTAPARTLITPALRGRQLLRLATWDAQVETLPDVLVERALEEHCPHLPLEAAGLLFADACDAVVFAAEVDAGAVDPHAFGRVTPEWLEEHAEARVREAIEALVGGPWC